MSSLGRPDVGNRRGHRLALLVACVVVALLATPARSLAASVTFHVENDRDTAQVSYVQVESPFLGNSTHVTDPYGDLTLQLNGQEDLYFTRDNNPPSTYPEPSSCRAPEDAGDGGYYYKVPFPTPTSTVPIILSHTTGDAVQPGLSGGENWVIGKLNEERQAKGMAPMHVSTTLNTAADAIAHDLAASKAAGGYAFPPPFCLVTTLDWGWPNGNFIFEDSPSTEPYQVLAHWDGTEGTSESHNLASFGVFSAANTAVGVGDGGGAWIIEYNACPAAGADRCQMTDSRGDTSGYTPPPPPGPGGGGTGGGSGEGTGGTGVGSGGGAPATGADAGVHTPTLTSAGAAGSATVRSNGSFTLAQPRVDCTGAGPDCSVTTGVTAKLAVTVAVAKRQAVSLGSLHFAVKAGTRGTVKSRLSRKGLKLLKRLHRVKAAVKIKLTRGATVVTKTVKVTLKAPKKHRK
jgi:hypothetical protein